MRWNLLLQNQVICLLTVNTVSRWKWFFKSLVLQRSFYCFGRYTMTYSVQKHNNENCDMPGLAAVPFLHREFTTIIVSVLTWSILRLLVWVPCTTWTVGWGNSVSIYACVCLVAFISSRSRYLKNFGYMFAHNFVCILRVKKKFNKCTMEIYCHDS